MFNLVQSAEQRQLRKNHCNTSDVASSQTHKCRRVRRDTHHTTAQEKVVFVHVYFRRRFQYLGTHLEAEEHLVLFEKSPASVPVVKQLIKIYLVLVCVWVTSAKICDV